VTSALSMAFVALAGQPGLRQQIVDDPAVIPDAVGIFEASLKVRVTHCWAIRPTIIGGMANIR